MLVSNSLSSSSFSLSPTVTNSYASLYTPPGRPHASGQKNREKGIFYHAQRMAEWRQMAPEIVSPIVSPAPRQLPRRLTPVASEPTLRPPPPTPNWQARLTSELWVNPRPEEQRPFGRLHLEKETAGLCINALPKTRGRRAGGRKKQSLPPMPSRDVPPLRRSQGVSSVGCPCCRRYRDAKPESMAKMRW